VRDPYDILGVKRGASFDEIKAAYRRACKTRHPDMGGSHEAMVEINTAYAFILNELKQGHAHEREEPKQNEQRRSQSEGAKQRERSWEQTYRDIDEELEAMRRAAEEREEALRGMRSHAWKSGDRTTWAKLTWEDLARFFRSIARSGVKGLALIFAALVGLGSVLVEANFVSGLILLGSGLGFAFSLALKNDKGGILSAALLLFGIMTIWLPPVRAALFLYPLATISVLILLALIFKFAQAGGTVGLMTGGVLALFVIAAILNDTAQHQNGGAIFRPRAPPPPYQPPGENPQPTPFVPTPPAPSPTVAVAPPAPRTLLAANGAILKFVSGIPYHLKVRNGRATFLNATVGTVKLISGDDGSGECVDFLHFHPEPSNGPWHKIDRTLRACEGDAIVSVQTSP